MKNKEREASTKVSPQSLKMSFNEVDPITAELKRV